MYTVYSCLYEESLITAYEPLDVSGVSRDSLWTHRRLTCLYWEALVIAYGPIDP